ncbi:MAG: FAD-dependent oxidoreductase, partial [Acidimicrobiales bacterium]
MKIAIVGAGVSGLTAAYVLSNQHDVTLFEREETLGGHAHTVDASGGDADYPVDTGFLVYNDATYPKFISLLERLGVSSKESSMSFSYQDVRRGLQWKGSSLNTIFAQRRNIFRLSFLRMVTDILSFNKTLRGLLESPISPTLTLADVLEQRQWSQEFVDWYLIPMGAAIWSADPLTFAEIPARTFAEFFSRHGLLRVRGRPVWRTIDGGSRSYVTRLEQEIALRGKIHLATPVESIRRSDAGVDIVTEGGVESFDHVVIACHSDEALAMLERPSDDERLVLGAIRYQSNDVTLHFDESLLPTTRRARAAWNYRRDNDDELATLTYDVSALQSIASPRRFLVSLNSDQRIDPAKVLARFRYSHPVLDQLTVLAQQQRHRLNENRTSYCGAYFGYGFHEDGVASALEACESLGASW